MRNKAFLVAQGNSQAEGQDCGEIFSPVACLEAIRILLAFAASKRFKLYQMDMKSAFLNGVIIGAHKTSISCTEMSSKCIK
jgi:hypothetical protein